MVGHCAVCACRTSLSGHGCRTRPVPSFRLQTWHSVSQRVTFETDGFSSIADVNHDKSAGFRSSDGYRNLRTLRHDETVFVRAQNNQRQLPSKHVLLIIQTLVRRHKHIKPCPFRRRDQRAVRLPGPSLVRRSYDLMIAHHQPQLLREVFIEQDFLRQLSAGFGAARDEIQ